MADMDAPHEMILNFLEEVDPVIRSRYTNYREDKLATPKSVSMTSLDKEEKNEVFHLLLKSELALKQFQDNPKTTDPSFVALKAMAFCYHLSTLEEIEIVDSQGDKVSKSLSEFYGQAIIDDPSAFWDIFFEMEVGSLMLGSDLNVNPIDASVNEASGGDLLYYTGKGEFVVECKNKRKSTDYEWELERLGREITDKLWTEHNLKSEIGDDSFAVNVKSSGDVSKELIYDRNKRAKLVKSLSMAAASLIKERTNHIHVPFEKMTFELTLKGYYQGRYRIELGEEEMSRLKNREYISGLVNPFSHLGIEPDVLESNGHGNISVEIAGDNEVEIFNAYAFELDIPWDIDYHEWIYSTIKGIPEQHADSENIIVFVKIPPAIIEVMKREKVINHRGEEVSKWKRLEERVIGIFADSNRNNRVKAVIISTDVIINKGTSEGKSVTLQEAVKPIYNKNVIEEVPEEFTAFIESENQIDYVFEMKGRFRLQDQQI